eukprot:gene15263-15412_t
MQAVLPASKAALGEAWLAAWMEAPIWRFRLPAGLCGPAAATGMFMPSVDKAGRHFPLTLASIGPDLAGPAWLDGAEDAGIAALEHILEPDEVLRRLQAIAADQGAIAEFDSHWSTAGAPLVPPTAFTCAGLPGPEQFTRMLAAEPVTDIATSYKNDFVWFAVRTGIHALPGEFACPHDAGELIAMRFRSGSSTHNGAVRPYNEDRLVDRPELGLWAVADGAGGHQAGEVASGMIADVLNAIPPGLAAGEMLAQVRLRISDVHAALCAEAASRGPHTVIASTIVVLIAAGEHFACLWAGDSRVYLLRAGVMRQITRDHSLVQELVETGAIRPEDAEGHPHANVITRAVGAEAEVFELDKVSGQLMAGDRFLLCSDGLCKTLSDPELGDLLKHGSGAAITEAMINAALARQVNDNVTAVVVEAGA